MKKTYKIDCVLHIIGCVAAKSEESAKKQFYEALCWDGEEQNYKMDIIAVYDD